MRTENIIILIFFGLIFLQFIFIPVRVALLHPFKVIYYFFKDIYHFFKYKKWRFFKAGEFTCYNAALGRVFGSGKTLSAANYVISNYNKYNDKKVWDFIRLKFVDQKIVVLSNVTLSIPYTKLTHLKQILDVVENHLEFDKVNNTRTCLLVLLDECQNSLNSRSFKENLNPLMLKALTECRHYNMSIIYDGPNFKQIDKLMRQCTVNVVACSLLWRFQLNSYYDAYSLENASDPTLVKPYKRSGFFVTDKIFNQFNSFEIVDTLKKARDTDDFLSDKEILENQGNTDIIRLS